MNDIFKALSDPTRREILEYLKKKEMTAGDIAEKFNMSKPSISHHLSILKNSKLVSSRREGQSIIYELNTTVFQEAVSWVYGIVDKVDVNEK